MILAVLSLGLTGASIAEAVEAMPPVRELGYSSKKEDKKKRSVYVN